MGRAINLHTKCSLCPIPPPPPFAPFRAARLAELLLSIYARSFARQRILFPFPPHPPPFSLLPSKPGTAEWLVLSLSGFYCPSGCSLNHGNGSFRRNVFTLRFVQDIVFKIKLLSLSWEYKQGLFYSYVNTYYILLSCNSLSIYVYNSR